MNAWLCSLMSTVWIIIKMMRSSFAKFSACSVSYSKLYIARMLAHLKIQSELDHGRFWQNLARFDSVRNGLAEQKSCLKLWWLIFYKWRFLFSGVCRWSTSSCGTGTRPCSRCSPSPGCSSRWPTTSVRRLSLKYVASFFEVFLNRVL